jgi:hypothetical protein
MLTKLPPPIEIVQPMVPRSWLGAVMSGATTSRVVSARLSWPMIARSAPSRLALMKLSADVDATSKLPAISPCTTVVLEVGVTSARRPCWR